tara:strand:- start:396 stop:1157 length:762 start_codon:yes stop_codon:yes gene_type:complete
MTQVAFLHVPKTAGTTLSKLIEDNLGPIAFYPPRCSPDVQERFGKVHTDFIAKVEAASGFEREALLADFRAHPAVAGHTTSAILPYLDDERFVFTSLREPGDRLVSWYFHYVHPDDPEKMFRPFREQTKGMSFDDFVSFEPMMSENDNVIVRYFSSAAGREPVQERHLEEAKQILSSLNLILFQKAQSEGQRALSEKLGWTVPEESEKLKWSRNRRRLGKEFEYSKSIMNKYIRFDRELVAFARELPNAIDGQ